MSGPTMLQRDFQARLQRLGQEQSEPEPEPDALAKDSHAWQKSEEARRPQLTADEARRVMNPGIRENIKYPLSFVWSFLIGAAVVFAIRFVRFHLFSNEFGDEVAGLGVFVDIGLVLAIWFGLRTFRSYELSETAYLKSKSHKSAWAMMFEKEMLVAQVVGVLAMLSLIHNFYHWAPEQMSALFSPEWTAWVIETSEANSIYFDGQYYRFGPAPAVPAEPVLPSGWSLN